MLERHQKENESDPGTDTSQEQARRISTCVAVLRSSTQKENESDPRNKHVALAYSVYYADCAQCND